jgi:hypothetical protein
MKSDAWLTASGGNSTYYISRASFALTRETNHEKISYKNISFIF